jgi:hypothetical protein
VLVSRKKVVRSFYSSRVSFTVGTCILLGVLGLLPLGRVEGWDLYNVLIDNGSQANIIFLHAYDHMGINHSML